MKKKITTTIIAILFTVSSFSSAAFASEVTGRLSSGPVSSQEGNGGQTSGTIGGSVIGGTTTTNTTSGGGAGGAGGRTTGGGSTGGNGGSTVTTTATGGPANNSGSNFTITGNAIAAAPSGAGTNFGGGNVTTPAGETPEEVAVVPTDLGNQTSEVPLAAAAGGITLGSKLLWGLFILLLLIIIGYLFYRKYGTKEHNVNMPKY